MKIKFKNFKPDDSWAHISDMMSGLMIIFLFISVAYMNSVTKAKNKAEDLYAHAARLAGAWAKSQDELYLDLFNEFKDDLSKWRATLSRENLSVRFEEPSVFFNSGSALLTPNFKAVLDDFFPRYIKILNFYKDNIAEVRIEGHTSSEWIGAKNNLDAYFNNMKLSQDRTRAVLNYCLNMPAMKEHQAWAISAITANGLSSSKLILNAQGKEDAALSRRVEFRVRTDADNRIMKILEEIK